MNIAILTVLLFGLLAAVAEATANKIRGTRSNDVMCLVIEVHKTAKDGHHEFFTCDLILEQEGTVHYGLLIDLPENAVYGHEETLRRGEWYVKITGATIEETYIEGHGMLRTSVTVPPGATIVTVSSEDGKIALHKVEGQESNVSRDRHLVSTGIRSVMVLRVSVSDSAPTFSTPQLTSDYFNMNSYSLVRQYHWCSFAQLQFVAYDASNPVVDVLITGAASSFTSSTLRQLAVDAVAAQKQVTALTSIANHVAIVLPPNLGDYNASDPWYALGQVGGWWSSYNDIWGGYPEFQMHEIGHNMGMGHAGIGDDEYADQSDIMGYGDYQQYDISKCFNGYHYNYLQWFSSRTLTVSAYTQNLVTLAAFPDYNLTSASQYVVIIVDSYYLIYNRRKGINYSVNSAIDKVTVVQSQAKVKSLLVAALDNTTAAFEVPNFGGGTLPLTIKVCSNTEGNVVDTAVISIGLGPVNCAGPTASTPPPTLQPTRLPTVQPTPPPTVQPTPAPTVQPSPPPTVQPTRLPTLTPTPPPTVQSTPPPTLQSTPPPTVQSTPPPTLQSTPPPTVPPTPPPSLQSTPPPTVQSTSPPTVKLTPAPTVQPTPPPTVQPTRLPTVMPAPPPTLQSTPPPTVPPTNAPIPLPTDPPTNAPTPSPTNAPNPLPTLQPTNAPVVNTAQTTPSPTSKPSSRPFRTSRPTILRTPKPTRKPTPPPTQRPRPTKRPSKPWGWNNRNAPQGN